MNTLTPEEVLQIAKDKQEVGLTYTDATDDFEDGVALENAVYVRHRLSSESLTNAIERWNRA